jgi:hypothetical protein
LTADKPPNAKASFHVLWDQLTDLIGTTAAATLLRRAARHAEPRAPALAGLLISKSSFEYVVVVPAAWNENGSDDLKILIQTLQPLLVELTGSIVVQRLRSIPALAPMLLEDDRD